MKTIHIKGYKPTDWLLKELYKKFLKDDDLWHYVYWENFWTHKAFIEGKNIILRINDKKVLNNVTKYLNKPEIEFEIYDFPFCRGKYQLGLKRYSWEAKNLDLSLPLLHTFSIAAIKIGKGERFKQYIDKYFHLAFNIAGYNHMDEAEFLSELLYLRIDLVKRMYRNKGKWK